MASKSRQKGLAARRRIAATEAKRKKATDEILNRKKDERDAAIAARKIADAQLGGLGRNLTNREVARVTEHLERGEVEQRAWARRMTDGPETVAHSGHRSGIHRS